MTFLEFLTNSIWSSTKTKQEVIIMKVIKKFQEKTLADAKKELASIGISIRKEDDEYRVNFKGGTEDTAYYTDDLDDAVGTGKLMAKEKKESAKAENKNIIELPEEVSIELEDRTVVLEKGERIEVMGKVEENREVIVKQVQKSVTDFYSSTAEFVFEMDDTVTSYSLGKMMGEFLSEYKPRGYDKMVVEGMITTLEEMLPYM